ncbi:MAG: hypothetical protein V1835_01110 [Candidatus Micrarchaeota archaeon]
MEMELKPAASLAVFAILFIDLFVPFASAAYYYSFYGGESQKGGENQNSAIYFADEPSPEPLSDATFEDTCIMSEMGAAEVARYQQGLKDFQMEQLSTLNDAALKKNDPTNAAAQQIQININLKDTPTYSIRDVANLLEYDDKGLEEMANEFKVNKDTGLLTLEQLKAVAARSPGGQDQLARTLGITTAGDIPKPQYEAFKVVLPNGKSVPLADLLKIQPQDKTNACLLDRSFISGKVTFQALLNKDLYVGFDQSKTTVKANQHLTSTNTAAALNSYAGSIVIPKMYEKYANTVGQWSTWEMWASLAGSGTILLTKKGPNEIKEEIEDLKTQLKDLSDYQSRSMGLQTQSGVQEEMTRVYLGMVKEKDLKTKILRDVDFEVITQQWRPLSIAIFGASWMGAARVALSASNQILFSSLKTTDKKLKDNYMQIYVDNKDFISGFRSGTDFFGTGKITDWVSDLMESGAPTKAFETGKIYFLARDASDDASKSGSFTSFEKEGDGWQVKMDWKGRSENSMFEDIKAWKDYSSFALYSNNLELGTTLANSKEFDNYFKTLGYAAPLVHFLLYRKADFQFVSGPVASIARIGIFDAVVTRLIDPVSFAGEACSEDIVDNYLTMYQIFTGLSMAQSVWSIYSPSKGLLPTLGAAAKTKLIGDAYNPLQTGWLSKYKDNSFVKNHLDFFKGASQREILETVKEGAEIEKQQMNVIDSMQHINTKVLPLAKTPEEIAEVTKQLASYETQALKLGEDSFKLNTKLSGMRAANIDEVGKGLTLTKFETAFKKLYMGMVLIDPVQLGKTVVGSNGFRYVSVCKDSSYKIAAYQKISGTQTGQNLQKKFDQLTKIDVAKQLNVSGLLGGIGQKVDEKSLAELLNLRAFTDNPYGQLNPEELYYIHLDGAQQQWFGVYDKLKANGCFRECHDSKDGYVCADATGVTYTDKKTGATTKLSDSRDRGLLTLMMQDLARTLVPNRIISAPLDDSCRNNEILQVQPGKLGGSLIISDDSCSTVQCLRQQLARLKAGITTDLSASAFGPVLAVYTDQGRITASEGRIRFIQGKSEDDDNSTVGVEIQAPSLEALDEKGLAELSGNVISIRGNGDVSIKGYINNEKNIDEEKVGKLLAIITDRGKIEFDENNNRLVVVLYVLAKSKAADSIKSISTSIRTNKDENGKDVPAIAITNPIPKVGGEKDAAELAEALKKVQTGADGKEGGFQVFETADKKYTIGTDENGKQTLTVYDKKTGETKQYEITGAPRKEGNDIIIPTDKGDFRFSIGMENGQPWLTATGPDGFKELAMLLAAKGAGGIIAFDPRTGLWYALNGQDIPWNQDFAKRGLSMYNTPDGTRGTASDNLLAYPRLQGSGVGNNNNPFSIPSFPENYAYMALMIATIMAGVMFVRIRRPD